MHKQTKFIIFLKTKQSYSITFFVIGIIIGLGFAILYGYKNYNITKKQVLDTPKVDTAYLIKDSKNSEAKTLSVKSVTKKKSPKAVIKTEKVEPTNENSSDTTEITDSNVIIDNVKIDTINIDTISEIIDDTLLSVHNDSIEYDILEIEVNETKEITLSKDELIYSTYLVPEGKKDNFDCNYSNDYDSVLVNNISNSNQDGIYIEFWQSPINYTGYKLNNKTLILFGIYEYNNIALKFTKEGFIELNYKENTFILKCSDEFVSLHIRNQ